MGGLLCHWHFHWSQGLSSVFFTWILAADMRGAFLWNFLWWFSPGSKQPLVSVSSWGTLYLDLSSHNWKGWSLCLSTAVHLDPGSHWSLSLMSVVLFTWILAAVVELASLSFLLYINLFLESRKPISFILSNNKHAFSHSPPRAAFYFVPFSPPCSQTNTQELEGSGYINTCSKKILSR